MFFISQPRPLVRKSYNDPKLTFDTNIGGSVNIFEAARVTPSVKVLIAITSDKCYKNKEWCWGYRENDELGRKIPTAHQKQLQNWYFLHTMILFMRICLNLALRAFEREMLLAEATGLLTG